MTGKAIFRQGKNFTVTKEAGVYFLKTSDGYETEYCYAEELLRDINNGYILDHYRKEIILIN